MPTSSASSNSLLKRKSSDVVAAVGEEVTASGKYPNIVPLQQDFGKLFSYCITVPSPPATKEFITALFFIIFASIACGTHNPFGNEKVVGGLVQFQAGDSICLFFKLFVFDRLIGDFGKRAIMYAIFFFSLAIQWPLMIAMFSEAPFPYVHISAEIGLFTSAIVRWRMM